MRILFIKSSSITHGGGSKAFMQMLDGLISYGVEPLVILPNKLGLYQTLKQNNISCVALKLQYRLSVYPWSNSFKNKLLFIPRLIGRLCVNALSTIQIIQIAKTFRPDIIHTNVSVISIGYYAARFLKIPHIWHIREYGAIDFSTFYYYPTFNRQLLRYKQKHSYTLCITKDLQKHNNLCNWNTSRVVYDGVLPSKYISYTSTKHPYFLFAGRIEHIKGILPLINAYAVYCKKHPSPIPLHIAGSGTQSYLQTVKSKIKHYGIENQVVFLGMRDDILSLYKEAKALIVPSIAEGFGFITAEAMFCGCLVIGYDVAGTKEQFDNAKEITGTEVALRYTTQEQLVQHLMDVTNNETAYYEQQILKAQDVVGCLYSTETHVKQIYDFYKYIIKQ